MTGHGHRPCLERVWYHGRALHDPPWQHDAAHPGVWLASKPRAALWYAGEDGEVLQATLNADQLCPGTPLLDLRDPDTFRTLILAAGLAPTGLRRAHTSGHLYLIGEGDAQRRLVEQAFMQGRALVMRDSTAGVSHLSLVVPTPAALHLLGPLNTRTPSRPRARPHAQHWTLTSSPRPRPVPAPQGPPQETP